MKAELLILTLLLISAVHASQVTVDVAEQLRGTFVLVNHTTDSGILNITTEFYNSGSVAYGVRLRADMNGTYAATVWTDERMLAPGNRTVFVMFWRGQHASNETVQLRAYFGNEIFEYGKFDISLPEEGAEDIFSVGAVRTTRSAIEFNLMANRSVQAVASVTGPRGWIFEQATLASGRNVIRYYPSVWAPEAVTLSIFSTNGLYYYAESVNLAQETDTVGLIMKALRGPLAFL